MSWLYNSLPITGVARTVAEIAGIPAPQMAAPPIGAVVNKARAAFDNANADRVFMYNPDAIALWLFQKYTALFEGMFLRSSVQMPLLSVMPSVTPVCFASMYTGAMPDVHGIQAYEKPVLKTDTLFDAYLRAGKKPAIVSTANDSISMIFLERDMDYFIYETVDECNRKAFELIERDAHDLIVLYNGNYDTAMHRNGPEAEASMDELRRNIETYGSLVARIEERWKGRRAMVGFCPDHGCHEIDGGLGSHGLDMPEDMNIIHFYQFL